MIGRRLAPPTSSKGSTDKSKQVKTSENRKQIGKEAEIKEEAWSPMTSPTPSWSELSLYWSEGSVSSRSQSPSSHSVSFLLSFGNLSLPRLSQPSCPQAFFCLDPLLLLAVPHTFQHQDRPIHICEVVKVFCIEMAAAVTVIFS